MCKGGLLVKEKQEDLKKKKKNPKKPGKQVKNIQIFYGSL